jgi:hypothetical protein
MVRRNPPAIASTASQTPRRKPVKVEEKPAKVERKLPRGAQTTEVPSAQAAIKIPKWPFSRNAETITFEQWPKVFKKIRDKAIAELEHENNEAQITIKSLLDELDEVKKNAANDAATIAAMKQLLDAP